jgi:hypothetical protein
LVVIVDAEEEFNWDAPFSRTNYSVKTMAAQHRAQQIFARYGVVPTYAVDFPVATQEDGYKPLLEFIQSRTCEVGAQLHPWVTPPFEEEISERNSFASNLPADLERRKIQQLTDMIERNFGQRPKLYRAGRYGAGRNTPRILAELGYEIDCSVLPGLRTGSSGPDYSGGISRPYWLGPTRTILELPVTVGTIGVVRDLGDRLYGKISTPIGRGFKLPAIMARLGLLERFRLTPEGTTLEEAQRLTRAMLQAGHRVFAVSYHTPSLVPGHTPYVQSQQDLATFLHWLEGYLDFFFGVVGGEAATPGGIWRLAANYSATKRAQFFLPPQQPLVSVVIPTFNSAGTIVRAIESAVGQTYERLEIIVVDDCSTDETASIVEKYAPQGVRLVKLNGHLGASGARNAGIAEAKGELIAFLDSDDEWLSSKIEKQVALIVTDPDLSFVSCGSNLISPAGSDLGDTYRGHPPVAGESAWKALLAVNFVATPTVLVWRRHVVALSGFDPSLKIGEDQDMWIRLALRGSLGYVNESLVRVHVREQSLSSGNFSDQLTYTLPMIRRHVASLAPRLSGSEMRDIMGERLARLGRVAYSKGNLRTGLGLILRSLVLLHRPLENLYYLATAAPPAMWVKRVLRTRLAP